MAQDKINTIIDRKAISSEIKETSKEIKDFIALIGSVKNVNVGVSQAKNMQEYSKLRKELEALIAQTNSATSAAIADAEARKAEAGATNLERKALQELYKAQILEEKARQENLKTSEKESAAKKKSTNLTLEEKIANQEATKIQKERIQIRNAEDGSMTKASLQYNKLTRIINNFSEAQRNSARGQTLVKYASDLNEKLKESDAKLNTFKRNVGNYSNSMAAGFELVAAEIAKVTAKGDAAKSNFQNLSGGRTTIKGFSQGNNPGFDENTTAQLKQFAAEADHADQELAQLNKTAQIGFQTNGNLKTQVKGLQTAFQNMSASGQVSEEFLKEFRAFTAQATDGLADLKGEIKALSSDTYVFDQISSVVQTMTGAFQIGASVATLFGAKEEDVQKNIQKLLVIQNVANGVQQIANQLTLRGSVLNKAYAFTQGLLTTALNTSATAALRFQSALGFIGIAAAVITGIVIAMQALSSSTKEANDNTSVLGRTLEDSNTEYTEAIKNINSLRINIDLAKKGFLDKKEVVKQYNESLGKVTGEVKSLEEAEKALQKNATAYIQFTLFKAAANLALEESAKKSVEAAKEGLTQAKTIKEGIDNAKGAGDAFGFDIDVDATEKQAKAASEKRKKSAEDESSDLLKVANDFQAKAAEIFKTMKWKSFSGDGNGDDTKEKDKKFFADTLELQRDAFDKIAKNEDAFISDRIIARKQAAVKEMQIVFGRANNDIENAKGDAEAIKEIRQKESNDLTRIVEKRNDDILELQKDFTDKIKKQRAEAAAAIKESQNDFFKEQNEKRIEDLEADFEVELAIIDQTKKKKLEKLSEQFRDSLITEKEYNEEKEKINVDFQLKELQAQIDFAKKLINIKKTYGFDTSDDEKKLAQLQIDLDNAVTENHINNNEKKKKSDEERAKTLAATLQKISEISANVGQAIIDIASIGFEKSKDQIDEQIELLNKKKEKDIEVANQTIANEKERAAVIFNITETEKARVEALNRRKRQIQVEQAKFERALNISEIIQRTALGVVTTLADRTIVPGFLRIPLAISVGALGLAQLVKAVSAPIPRFKHGGEVKQTGLIIVGDGGKHEKMNFPDGSFIKTPRVPTLMHAVKGVKIDPDYDKAMTKASVGVVPMYDDRDIKIDSSAPELLNEVRGMRRDIQNMPQSEIKVENLISKSIRGNKILRA